MDYLEKIREAFVFTWKYKKLWVFGFILAVFGGGTSGNFNFGNNFNSSNFNSDSSDFADSIDKITNNAAALVILCSAFIIFLILWLVGWYLLGVAKAALVNSVRLDMEGKTPTLGAGWKFGNKLAFRYMFMDILVGLINLLIFSPIIILIIAGAVFGGGVAVGLFCIACLLSPLFIAYMLFFTMIYTAAQRLVVLENLSAWSALKAGYGLAKERWQDFIFGWLVFLLPGCVWGLIRCLIMIIPVLFLMGVIIVALVSGNVLMMLLVIIPAILVVIFIGAAVNSPFSVMSHTYWTKVIMEMRKK